MRAGGWLQPLLRSPLQYKCACPASAHGPGLPSSATTRLAEVLWGPVLPHSGALGAAAALLKLFTEATTCCCCTWGTCSVCSGLACSKWLSSLQRCCMENKRGSHQAMWHRDCCSTTASMLWGRGNHPRMESPLKKGSCPRS